MLKPEARNLVLDNKTVNYFESLVYACFRIDIHDLISIKAQVGKAFGIQPSEIDKFPFWEFELYTKELERLVKDENKRQEDEYKKSGAANAMKMTDPAYASKMSNAYMPKAAQMPKMPSFKMQ